jgi:hypothetical protein
MPDSFAEIELRVQQEKSHLTDPTNDWRVSQPTPCIGCGELHGPVNSKIACLTRHLLESRAENTRLKDSYAELLSLKREKAEREAVVARNRISTEHFDRTRGPGKR